VASSPQSASDRDREFELFCGVKIGVLGRVESADGRVQILATRGMPNGKTENRMTAARAVLGYSLKMPSDATIGADGRPFEKAGALNFYGLGASFTLRSNGPITSALCFLSPGFLAGLTNVENDFQLDDVEALNDIQSERLTYLGQVMFREALQPGYAGALFVEAIGMAVALEIARYAAALRAADKPRRGGLAPWQMLRLKSHIQANLSRPLGLDELAEQLGVSTRHLSRAVRQAIGTSVHSWIADLRLAEARRLLAETDLPIQEIALRCAFQSIAAFSTAFRAGSGFAPSEFRRLNHMRA
jgi:AraC family transcriptional regulator